MFLLASMVASGEPKDARQTILNNDTLNIRARAETERFDFERTDSISANKKARFTECIAWTISLLVGNAGAYNLARGRVQGLQTLAKQYAILSATELQQRDARPPVIYLRSFADEQTTLPKPLLDNESQLESAILKNGSFLGPVVAIGLPSDLLPPIGVARDYIGDDAWQGLVNRWMDSTQIVIIVIGHSPGVAWESVTLLRKNLLSKSVFVIPPLSQRVRE